MSLIELEHDDEAVLRAEDEAIREAEREKVPEAAIPTGDDLAKLIEDLSHGAGQQVHSEAEG